MPLPKSAVVYPEPTLARRALMSRVRQKNTTPEIEVRKALHRLGYRFRLHRRDLPGTPDIVLGSRKKAVFVHGCFWHRHDGCRKRTTPKTRVEFWESKFDANQERDRRKIEQLEAAGWSVLVVWECEVRSSELEARLRNFIEGGERRDG